MGDKKERKQGTGSREMCVLEVGMVVTEGVEGRDGGGHV